MVSTDTKKKHAGGRPSKINAIDETLLEKLYLDGKTDVEVAYFIGVTGRTLHNWKNKYPKFFHSLKEWKKQADERVEKSLYKRAIGYTYDEITYEKLKIGGLGIQLSKEEIEAIKHVETNKTKVVVKEIVPDVTAQIFWLKNRQPKQWRDRQEVEHSGTINFGELIKKANGNTN